VDIDDRALQATETNARDAGVKNMVVCTPRAVPAEVLFQAIYTNPPTRIGKPALRALLLHWLGRLWPEGTAYLTIKRQAGADSLAAFLAQAGCPPKRLVVKQGYRVFATGRPEDR
jgi:16S rRNA (guanine1207-N2)-methyltransferase